MKNGSPETVFNTNKCDRKVQNKERKLYPLYVHNQGGDLIITRGT